MSDTFGLELTFRIAGESIKKKEDALVVIVHWFLTKFGFRCIGLGDDKSLTGNESGSELLPSNWSDPETYSLRYTYDGKLYILRGVRTDDILIINLLYTPDLNVSNLTLTVSELVVDTKGSVDKMVPSYVALIERIRKELVEPVTKKISAEATTQTAQQQPSNPRVPHPLADVPHPAVGPVGPTRSIPDPMDPFGYGRSDLDPLGVGGPGGGMVFDPFRGARGRFAQPPGGLPLPRGRVPGSRFDPVLPPGIGRAGPGMGPDPDHLPPPGYDDMFM